MEIIQFHLLVKTSAEILVNSKRRKNGKTCWDVAERKPFYFLRIVNFFLSFPSHLYWQNIELIVVFAGKPSTNQHLLSLMGKNGSRTYMCFHYLYSLFLGEEGNRGVRSPVTYRDVTSIYWSLLGSDCYWCEFPVLLLTLGETGWTPEWTLFYSPHPPRSVVIRYWNFNLFWKDWRRRLLWHTFCGRSNKIFGKGGLKPAERLHWHFILPL